ncbi:ATP-citrate synthase alpha chain protein 3-like [Miscanthus floridulus]|uniref:ATP-citrate synthase alpha chain protein 3-like n=1 Tax=Miscanthus floridulus TaxID=154761 RepID=UPI003459181D
MKLVVKPDMLFGKRGKSGLVALNLDLAQVRQFVKERLGVEVEMGGCKAPITTFIVEPFVPHDQEYYLSIGSERLGSTISFSECGGIEIEENWDKVKTIFLPTEKQMTPDACAPLIATLPLVVTAVVVVVWWWQLWCSGGGGVGGGVLISSIGRGIESNWRVTGFTDWSVAGTTA